MDSAGVQTLYRLLIHEIEAQVAESDALRVIVDGRREVEETVLRYANRAVVSQHEAYFARPWAPRDPRTSVFGFACKCGDDGCEEQVALTVADFPAPPDATSPPVLAQGHRTA